MAGVTGGEELRKAVVSGGRAEEEGAGAKATHGGCVHFMEGEGCVVLTCKEDAVANEAQENKSEMSSVLTGVNLPDFLAHRFYLHSDTH